MARHNEVTLYGQVGETPPRLQYNTDDPNNPERRLVRAMCPIIVIRGIRDFGAKDKRPRLDMPLIMSLNPKVMKVMEKWEPGDIVFIRGTLATVDVDRAIKCPYCGAVQTVKATNGFINPIFMKIEHKHLSSEEGNMELRKNAEISNRITVIGKVDTDPEIFRTSEGQRITNYKLDIPRKYHIREDDDTNRHDFPVVKSYGFIADADMEHLKKGATVFIDGSIQTRTYPYTATCPACGQSFEYTKNATEIIPYSTEYLMGTRSPEEIEEYKTEQTLKEAAAVKKDVFGED